MTKTITISFIVTIVLTSLFSSCKKDNGIPLAPMIDSITDQRILEGDILSLEIYVKNGDDNLNEESLSIILMNGDEILEGFSVSTSNTNNGMNVTLTRQFTDAGNYMCTVNVVDENGCEDEKTFQIIVNAKNVISFWGIKLFADPGNSASNCSSNNGIAYSLPEIINGSYEIQENIDISYYFNETLKASLTSPNLLPVSIARAFPSITSKNQTKYGYSNITESEFNAITADNDSIIVGQSEINNTKLSHLQTGDIIAFETINGKKGVIVIRDIYEIRGSEGYILFDLKRQK